MLLDYFDYYTLDLGWQVIPVNGKKPINSRWNGRYNRDWCRSQIERNPTLNLGLLLGDIIDVEADNDTANRLLQNLTQIPHPQYRSEKSVHHLFLPPLPHLTRSVFQGIEFRGHRHQSLLPPSINDNNVKYQWLRVTHFPVPPMPPSLRRFFFQHWQPIKKNFIQATCRHCQRSWPIHKKRLHIELIAIGGTWLCQHCRHVDLRPLCRRIKKAGC